MAEKQYTKKKKKGVKVPFQALYTSLHIHEVSLEICDKGTPFFCCIDGNYYGPFESIKITPVELIDRKQFFLPIMCFMPGSEI